VVNNQVKLAKWGETGTFLVKKSSNIVCFSKNFQIFSSTFPVAFWYYVTGELPFIFEGETTPLCSTV